MSKRFGRDEDAVSHSQCGQQFAVGNPSEAKKESNGFPIAGGILMMVAGCLLTIYGVIGVLASLANLHRSDFYPSVAMGVAGLIGGFLNLYGGTEAFRRKSWTLSLTSAVFALIAEVVYLLMYGSMSPYGDIVAGLFVTLPVIAISLLGLILVASSKAQFSGFSKRVEGDRAR